MRGPRAQATFRVALLERAEDLVVGEGLAGGEGDRARILRTTVSTSAPWSSCASLKSLEEGQGRAREAPLRALAGSFAFHGRK